MNDNITKKRILVVDPLEEKGHINFNRSLCAVASIDNDVFFMTGKSYSANVGFSNTICFYEFPRCLKTILHPRIVYIFYIFQIIFHLSKKRYDLIVFSSYDSMSFLLFWFFFREGRFALINHNNLDFKGSKIKSFVFKCIPKRFYHVCLESYIAEYLENVFDKKTILMNHPIYIDVDEVVPEEIEVDSSDSVIVYSPSGSNKVFYVNKFLDFMPFDWFFVAKKTDVKQKENERCCYKEWFSNYYGYMKRSDIVFIGQDFGYRVSGVFYEALSMKKRTIMPRCKFSEALIRRFPSSILFLEEDLFSDRHALEVSEEDYSQFIREHNDKSLRYQLDELLQ